MSFVSRRGFLAGSAASFAAGPALAQRAARTATPSEVDCIIVGAGAAGIAAARRLRETNRSFVLIEASNRIGGRCVTETKSFGVPFDRGAHLIHNPDSNPLTKLASRTGLEIYPAPTGQRIRVGRRNAREGELEDYLTALVRANRAIADAVRGRARSRQRERVAARSRRVAERPSSSRSGPTTAARISPRFPRRISAARPTATSARSAARASARCSPSSPKASRCRSTPR